MVRRPAHAAVMKAIASGVLVRPVHCERCREAVTTIHGHHESYDRPLEVVWLCSACHCARHRNLQHLTLADFLASEPPPRKPHPVWPEVVGPYCRMPASAAFRAACSRSQQARRARERAARHDLRHDIYPREAAR